MALHDVTSQISTQWRALTPVGSASPPYRLARTDEEFEGEGAHRMFAHGLPSGGVVIEQSSALTVYEFSWTSMLKISALRHDKTTLIAAVENETHQLIASVETTRDWPSGTRDILVTGFSVEIEPDDMAVIEIQIRAHIERTN